MYHRKQEGPVQPRGRQAAQKKRTYRGFLYHLLVIVLIAGAIPIIGPGPVETASAAPATIANDSLSVRIGNIGQVEVFNIRNNRNNRNNQQPNFVMPNTESNLSTNTHQYMGEMIFSTRAAESRDDLAAKSFVEQDINKTLAAAPAGAMTQYSNFTDANLAANPNIDIDYGDNKVTVDYKGYGLNSNTARTMKGYDVRQEWDMNTPDDSLLRTITVKNVSEQYIEFGDVGLPMPWNNKYNSLSASYNDRMMVHNFAGADSGYTQVIRPSGEGNYVIFAPVPASGARLEYVEYVQSRASFQGVTGYRANSVYGGLGGDDGGWQPGLNILYQHAKNVYAGNGGGYMPVSTFTSKVLAPGEEVTYQYKYFAVRAGDGTPQENADSPNNASDSVGERETNMRSIFYKNGMMDMLAVPSFSTFLNMPTKLDLHYDDKRITDVQLEIMCVHENDPYDLEHIPNTGTPYNVNNSRGGRGLHNAPENAAYQRSISAPKRTVDARGEAHHVYDLSFDCIGNTSVGVRYKLDGVEKYTESEFSVMPEIDATIDAHAAFNYSNRVTSGNYTGQYLEYTMHGAASSNTASADDWGWDQGNFMAQKNLLRPNQAEITSLESLHINLYWGRLVNNSTYAVSNAFNATGSRTFTHQMAATSFFAMYQILKTYPELTYREGYGATWYLNIACNIYNRHVATSTGTGFYGEQFIEPLIAALRTEGMATEANTLQARFTGASSGKGYTMSNAAYPYGSEFPFDNTGEEGAYFSAKALRTYAPGNASFERAFRNMLLAEWKTRACRGLQPTWFHYANVVFLGGEGWWNSQYTTPLAAAIMDDYLKYQNNGYDNDERAWAERVNYAAKLSAFSHVNMGQIASTAIGNISWRYTAFKGRFGAMNVNDQNGNRTQYNGWNDFSGEADENLYGSLLRLSSDVVTDPIFGLYGYGSQVSDNGDSYTVKPLDGIGKKFNFLNEEIYLALSRDEASSATVAKTGRYMTFQLKNQTATAHSTRLSVEGLKQDGRYYVVKVGTRAPQSEFTVTGGNGLATFALAAGETAANLLVIYEGDYNLDGPTVLADVSSTWKFKDVPIKLSGQVFNADSYTWTIQSGPEGAAATFAGADTLTPSLTTDTAGDYVVRLTAKDSDNVESFVDVAFTAVDRATFPAPEILTGEIVSGKLFPGYNYQLTGNATTGIPEGGVAYQWTGGAGVTFSDATAPSPTVKAEEPGTYVLTLTVTDDIGRVATKPVNVVVVPLSESDPPQVETASIVSGKLFPAYDYKLTGRGTTGIPVGRLKYRWTGPEGATFSDASVPSPTVKFDAPGEYALRLTLTDDIDRTVEKVLNVVVVPLSESDPPAIETCAIEAGALVVGGTYGLTGIATSGIPGSDALSYKWTTFPAGGVTFSGTGAASAFPTVRFTIPRTYEFTLTVTDKIGRTDKKSFTAVVAENLSPLNVALTTKGTTLQNIHQNGGARTAPLNGGDTPRGAASTLNSWGTSSSASRHWFQLTFADPVTLYGVDIMWSSDGGGTQPPAASTGDSTRNELLVPAVTPAVPVANDALTFTAANWARLPMQDKAGATIVDIPRVTNGTSTNNVWNFAGFAPRDTQYLLMNLNRPGSGNGVGVNYWRAYALEPVKAAEDLYAHVGETELDDPSRRAEIFPAAFETAMKRIDFQASRYAYLNHDIALKWTPAQITAAQNAAVGAETIVTGTNATLGYSLRVHIVKGSATPEVVSYDPVATTAVVGGDVILPDTATALLNDETSHTLAVTWDIPAGITDTPGPKTISGAVTLPAGWTGPSVVTASLTVVEDAKAFLGNVIQAFEALDPDDYITASYNAAKTVCDEAKRVYDYAEAQLDEITQAANDLLAAMEGLGKKADGVILDILQNVIDSYSDLVEDDYLAPWWQAFEDAVNAAQEILDNPDLYAEEDVFNAISDLITAGEELLQHTAANKAALRQAITEAETLLLEEDTYIPSAVTQLKVKLAEARLVVADTSALQEDVDDAFEALTAALKVMYKKGDKRPLQTLITLVKLYAEANYTPTSWTGLQNAIEGAEAVIDDENAVKEHVEAAYTALNNAMKALVRKANTAALSSAVKQAQAILDDLDKYIPASVVGLAEQQAAAKAVLENGDSTQAQVNAAATALNTAILKARLKPDMSGLSARMVQAKSLDLKDYTDASASTLKTAMVRAASILGDKEMKAPQTEVDAAESGLITAIAALKDKGGKAVTKATSEQKNKNNTQKSTGSVSAGKTGALPQKAAATRTAGSSAPVATAADSSATGSPAPAGGTGAADVSVPPGTAPVVYESPADDVAGMTAAASTPPEQAQTWIVILLVLILAAGAGGIRYFRYRRAEK